MSVPVLFSNRQIVDSDYFLPVSTFLSPEDLATVERVSKFWKKTLDAKNERFWKPQFLRFFSDDIQPHQRAEKIYKRLLVPIYGDLFFSYQGIGSPCLLNAKMEPIFTMNIRLNRLDVIRLKAESFPTLRRVYFAFESPEFSKNISLRCFINPEDNAYKKVGERIKSLWHSHRLILTCINRNNDRFNDLDERIAADVASAIQKGRFAEEYVHVARIMAKASGEWVYLD